AGAAGPPPGGSDCGAACAPDSQGRAGAGAPAAIALGGPPVGCPGPPGRCWARPPGAPGAPGAPDRVPNGDGGLDGACPGATGGAPHWVVWPGSLVRPGPPGPPGPPAPGPWGAFCPPNRPDRPCWGAGGTGAADGREPNGL